MNFNLKAPITSVVAGAADFGLEYWDAKSGRGAKPFQNATDIGRAVMAVGGYGVAWLMPRYHLRSDEENLQENSKLRRSPSY
jgi:hypothetical protein